MTTHPSTGVRPLTQPYCIIGQYCYTTDLLKMQAAEPRKVVHCPELLHIRSPLLDHLTAWQRGLAAHPDRAFANYITGGIRDGFRIGFSYTRTLNPARRNMPSAEHHPEVVEAYLAGEVPAGRIIGPLPPGTTHDHVQINRLGVIPKGHAPGRWRLITDLSFPADTSVNDGIDPQVCSIRYTTVDKVAKAAGKLGIGALVAKLDVRSAYRLVPVHPDDRQLLGFQWQGARYVDGMLPFGLRSAPKIFTALADALEWIAR